MDKYQQNIANWHQLMDSLKRPYKFIPAFYWAKEYSLASGRKTRPIDQNDYCQVRMWMIDNKYMILISQEHDNDSMSVTNASEYICTAIINSQGLNIKDVTFFESYEGYDREGKPYFDHVYFDIEERNENIILKNPYWKQETERFIKLLNM